MGQVTVPSSGGITVIPTDRESGPGAGAGASGNRALFLGAAAGKNTAISDVIALGNNTLQGGIADANAAGMVAVGSQAGKAMTAANVALVNFQRPSVFIGFNAAAATVNIGAAVVIGAGALAANVGAGNTGGAVASLVAIGTDALGTVNGQVGNETPPTNSVVIGGRAAYGTAGAFWTLQNSVLIGDRVCENTGGGATGSGSGISSCVVIGQQAGTSMGSTGTAQNNTLIGANCGSNITVGSANTAVGQATTVGINSNRITAIGQGIANAAAVADTVTIGALATNQGNRNIYIGAGCATTTLPGVTDDVVLIETVSGGTKRTMLYAVLSATGSNIVLGNSTEATNRDTGGAGALNIVKLLNGVKGASNPVGGGYFYVTAGALHYVGSAGTDTTVAPA